ncbi:unnamed protein product [Clavelina lepadiformis]|uniref:Uncharacterized protein n=1 Tax=Clavelina lepadiformis TaxID=159417 RepID=A0ABP0FBD9_CLALP
MGRIRCYSITTIRLHIEFPYLTSIGSRCTIGGNAPHVRKTVMAIIFTATTTTLSFATTNVQSSDDLISKVLTTFNEENMFLHCQLTKLIGTLYRAVGKIFPAEILTTTLGHQAMSSSLGDFMSRAA